MRIPLGIEGIPVFDGPIAKVRRAHEHVHSLWRVTERYVNAYPYVITRERDDDGWYVGKFGIVKPPPTDLALIVGDALHNARSALDQSIYVTSRAPAKVRGYVSFPIYRDQLEYLKVSGKPPLSARDRAIAGVPKKYWAIIDDSQPYNRRYELLEALRAFDNADKHRLVHITFLRQTRPPTFIYRNGGADDIEVLLAPASRPMREGTEIYRWRPRKEGMEVDIYLEFTVAFRQGRLRLGPLEIQRIVNLVGGVVIGISYAAADRGRDGMPLRTRKRRPGTSPTGP